MLNKKNPAKPSTPIEQVSFLLDDKSSKSPCAMEISIQNQPNNSHKKKNDNINDSVIHRHRLFTIVLPKSRRYRAYRSGTLVRIKCETPFLCRTRRWWGFRHDDLKS